MSRPIEAERSPVRKELPIFTDEQVKESVRGQINHIVKQIKKPSRSLPFNTRTTTSLFVMRQQQYSFFKHSLLEDPWGNFIGKANTNSFEELTLEVMGEFGFDPKLISGRESKRISAGTRSDITRYPSKTIKGLVFDRVEDFAPVVEDYYIAGECLIRIEWKAKNAAPRFRIENREKVGTKKVA